MTEADCAGFIGKLADLGFDVVPWGYPSKASVTSWPEQIPDWVRKGSTELNACKMPGMVTLVWECVRMPR